MPNITITGKTFQYRDTLKAFGARFNGDKKYWTLINADDTTVESLRALPGLSLDVYGEPIEPVVPAPRTGTLFIGSDQTYFNEFTCKNPRTFAGFYSLAEMCDYVANIPSSIASDRDNNRNRGWDIGDSWFGSHDMAGALDYARDGWRTGVLKAQQAIEALAADHPTRRQRKLSVAGGRANIGKLLSGNPVHMVTRQRQPSQKVITLFVETVMSNTITVENAVLRAATVAAMSDMLETNGYSCEIISTMSFNRSRAKDKAACHITVALKRAGDPLNLNDIVFALGHPSMLRRLGFAIMAVNPDQRSDWPSMGKVAAAFDADKMEPGSFYISPLYHTDQAAVTGDTLAERVRSLFPLIVPENFPVTLAE